MSDHIPGPGKMVSARDVVARAMLDSIGLSNTSAAQGEDNADAILSALAAAGYAVVPVEPNEAMAHAGGCASEPGVRMEGPMPSSKHKARTIYRAMLAAAKETQA